MDGSRDGRTDLDGARDGGKVMDVSAGSHDGLLESAYGHLMALLDDLDGYRSGIDAESARADRPELTRLLGLQAKRIDLVAARVAAQIEPPLRDLLDRLHVVREARAGRFN